MSLVLTIQLPISHDLVGRLYFTAEACAFLNIGTGTHWDNGHPSPFCPSVADRLDFRQSHELLPVPLSDGIALQLLDQRNSSLHGWAHDGDDGYDAKLPKFVQNQLENVYRYFSWNVETKH